MSVYMSVYMSVSVSVSVRLCVCVCACMRVCVSSLSSRFRLCLCFSSLSLDRIAGRGKWQRSVRGSHNELQEGRRNAPAGPHQLSSH